MEWTDGMEYQVTKIAKTHYRGRGEVVSTVLSLLASTGLLCLASVFALYPGPHTGCSGCGRGYVYGFGSVDAR